MRLLLGTLDLKTFIFSIVKSLTELKSTNLVSWTISYIFVSKFVIEKEMEEKFSSV